MYVYSVAASLFSLPWLQISLSAKITFASGSSLCCVPGATEDLAPLPGRGWGKRGVDSSGSGLENNKFWLSAVFPRKEKRYLDTHTLHCLESLYIQPPH